MLDREITAFEPQPSVSNPVSIGMDVIVASDLIIRRDGTASLTVG